MYIQRVLNHIQTQNQEAKLDNMTNKKTNKVNLKQKQFGVSSLHNTARGPHQAKLALAGNSKNLKVVLAESEILSNTNEVSIASKVRGALNRKMQIYEKILKNPQVQSRLMRVSPVLILPILGYILNKSLSHEEEDQLKSDIQSMELPYSIESYLDGIQHNDNYSLEALDAKLRRHRETLTIPNRLPILPSFSLKERLTKRIQSELTDIFGSKDIEKAGLGYLDYIFRQKPVHDTSLKLLVNGIKDKRFIPHSKVYGIDLVNHAFGTQECKAVVKKMSLELCQDANVQRASTQLLSYVVSSDVTKSFMTEHMKALMSSNDILPLVSRICNEEGYKAMTSQPNRAAMTQCNLHCIGDERTQTALKHSLVKVPLWKLVTLGFGSD